MHSQEELQHVIISRMIHTLVSDLVQTSTERITASGVKNITEVRKQKHRLIGFSEGVEAQKNELKDFLMQHMYMHWRVVRMEEKANRVLTELFNAFMKREEQISISFRRRYFNDSTPRMICDYLAGMTDRFALDEYKKLFDPHQRV